MNAQEAYKKMIEYSSSRNNCCWYAEECVNGIDDCGEDKEQCEYYQAFLKVKKALKILEILEEEIKDD